MKWVALSAAMMLAVGCKAPAVIERGDVAGFESGYDAQFDAVTIKGAYAQTPLQSRRVKTEQVGSDLFVHLMVSHVPGLGRNNFEYAVGVTPEIERVYFGDEKALIWERGRE